MSDFKPGDVAMVEFCSDGEWRRAVCDENLHGLVWRFPSGSYRIVSDSAARPLVVLDPESAEDVRRLWGLIVNQRNDGHMSSPLDVETALREFAQPTPEKPDEPLGLGAVVEDAAGVRWVRGYADLTGCSWVNDGSWRDWFEFEAVTVLSEGVSS